MTTLATLLQPGHPSGVLRTETDPSAELRRAGWRVVRARATTKAGLLRELADRLDFPDYFAHNLDALLDCLRDVSGPTALVWTGWRELHDAHPATADAVLSVFRTRAAERPGFCVVILG